VWKESDSLRPHSQGRKPSLEIDMMGKSNDFHTNRK
jgi:hypothetical protein